MSGIGPSALYIYPHDTEAKLEFGVSFHVYDSNVPLEHAYMIARCL